MPITTEPKGPKPLVPGCIKVAFTFSSNAGPVALTAANVLHVTTNPAAPLAQVNLDDFNGHIGTAYENRFKAYRSSFWTLRQVASTYLDGSGLATSGVFNSVGTAGGNNIAPSTCITLSWRAGAYWRGGKPRTYLPGPTTSQLTNIGSASLLSATTAALATAANSFIADVAALNDGGKVFALGFVSYYSKGVFRPFPLFFPFTAAVVHDRLDSQRRRSGKERFYGVD